MSWIIELCIASGQRWWKKNHQITGGKCVSDRLTKCRHANIWDKNFFMKTTFYLCLPYDGWPVMPRLLSMIVVWMCVSVFSFSVTFIPSSIVFYGVCTVTRCFCEPRRSSADFVLPHWSPTHSQLHHGDLSVSPPAETIRPVQGKGTRFPFHYTYLCYTTGRMKTSGPWCNIVEILYV